MAESSDEEILDEAKAKSEEMEDGDEEEEEEEMEEAVSIPKTKAGMIKALYDQLNGMKKADLSDSFAKIMGSTLKEEDDMEDEEDEEEEKPMENRKLKKEDLELNVKDDIEAERSDISTLMFNIVFLIIHVVCTATLRCVSWPPLLSNR